MNTLRLFSFMQHHEPGDRADDRDGTPVDPAVPGAVEPATDLCATVRIRSTDAKKLGL